MATSARARMAIPNRRPAAANRGRSGSGQYDSVKIKCFDCNISRCRDTASRCALQAQLTLLRQHVFAKSKIMQQPLADKPEEIEAELRILEIELPHLIVVDHQDLSRFRALDRRSSV